MTKIKKKDKLTRLIAVPDWEKYHPWPPVGGLRHLIQNRMKNGFDNVLKKVSTIWLIDETAFFEWVDKETIRSKKENKPL